VAPVNDVSDLASDAQVLARDMLVSLTSPESGTIRLPGNPIKMRGARSTSAWAAPPILGNQPLASWSSSSTVEQSFDPSLVVRSKDGAGWELAAQGCLDCGLASFGPPRRCPVCGSNNGASTSLGETGTLATWSRIAGKPPYIVGYVDLPVSWQSAQLPAGWVPTTVRVFGPIQVDTEKELTLGMQLGVRFESSSLHGAQRIHHVFVPMEGLPHVDR
jgi:uncharacterized OB-fold protein